MNDFGESLFEEIHFIVNLEIFAIDFLITLIVGL